MQSAVEDFCFEIHRWASPNVENPTDLSHPNAISPLNQTDCLNESQGGFLAYQNYGNYYHGGQAGNPEEHLYHSTTELASAHQSRSRHTVPPRNSSQFDSSRLSFTFRTDPQSPSNRSSSDQ